MFTGKTDFKSFSLSYFVRPFFVVLEDYRHLQYLGVGLHVFVHCDLFNKMNFFVIDS